MVFWKDKIGNQGGGVAVGVPQHTCSRATHFDAAVEAVGAECFVSEVDLNVLFDSPKR